MATLLRAFHDSQPVPSVGTGQIDRCMMQILQPTRSQVPGGVIDLDRATIGRVPPESLVRAGVVVVLQALADHGAEMVFASLETCHDNRAREVRCVDETRSC